MKARRLSVEFISLAVILASPGCGKSTGTSTPSQPARANASPTASISVSPAGQAITGVTVVTLTASATDPDGDSLTFSWQFGDGTSGSGQSANKIYSTEGTFNVVLAVSDGRGGSTTASAIVSARSLTGFWTSEARAWNFQLQQNGPTLSGALVGFKGETLRSPFSLSGAVRSPRAVEFTVPGPFVVGTLRFPSLSFSGTADGTINAITGILDEGRNFNDILRRR